jgi:HK97 gp10 family phage protein
MAVQVTWRVLSNDFPKIIANLEPLAEKIVAKAALDIQAQAQTRAPVRFGFLKASIQATRIGPAHWRVTVGAEYGIYQEFGTVHMAAQPYFRPAIEAVRAGFLQAMKGVVKP